MYFYLMKNKDHYIIIHLDRPAKFKIQISQSMTNSTHFLKC